jgi:hypothetical protein
VQHATYEPLTILRPFSMLPWPCHAPCRTSDGKRPTAAARGRPLGSMNTKCGMPFTPYSCKQQLINFAFSTIWLTECFGHQRTARLHLISVCASSLYSSQCGIHVLADNRPVVPHIWWWCLHHAAHSAEHGHTVRKTHFPVVEKTMHECGQTKQHTNALAEKPPVPG